MKIETKDLNKYVGTRIRWTGWGTKAHVTLKYVGDKYVVVALSGNDEEVFLLEAQNILNEHWETYEPEESAEELLRDVIAKQLYDNALVPIGAYASCLESGMLEEILGHFYIIRKQDKSRQCVSVVDAKIDLINQAILAADPRWDSYTIASHIQLALSNFRPEEQ